MRHTTLWSLLTPLLGWPSSSGWSTRAAADCEAIAAALDEVAGECGPAQESFVNPAKTLALELLGAMPVIAAEGPLAGAAARPASPTSSAPWRASRSPPSGCPTSGSR